MSDISHVTRTPPERPHPDRPSSADTRAGLVYNPEYIKSLQDDANCPIGGLPYPPSSFPLNRDKFSFGSELPKRGAHLAGRTARAVGNTLQAGPPAPELGKGRRPPPILP